MSRSMQIEVTSRQAWALLADNSVLDVARVAAESYCLNALRRLLLVPSRVSVIDQELATLSR